LVTRGRATIAAALFSVTCFQRWEKHNQPLRWWFNALVLSPVLRVLNKVMNSLWINPGR